MGAMTTLGITEADALLSVIEGEFRELESAEFLASRYKASRLRAARDELVRLHGKREGLARFREWRAESLGMGQSVASKLLTVADHLPERVPDIPQGYLYLVARCVRLGKGTAEDLLAEAEVTPQGDFLAKYELVKPRQPKSEPTLTCPSCAFRGWLSSFEEESL